MRQWIAQRFYDVVSWPIYMIKQAGQRFLRLRTTCHQLLRFCLTPPQWQKTRFLFLIHKLVCEWFDLWGGAELAQVIYRATTSTTPLTETEKMMARSVLGGPASWLDEVRVAEGGLLDWIFQHNGGLAYATWNTVNFPRDGQHTRHNYPILIHELTHVWQYQQVGTRYIGEAIYVLVKTQRDCYNYGGVVGLQVACEGERPFASFNREQQAQIAQDYFARCELGEDVEHYRPFIRQLQQGQL